MYKTSAAGSLEKAAIDLSSTFLVSSCTFTHLVLPFVSNGLFASNPLAQAQVSDVDSFPDLIRQPVDIVSSV